MRYRVAGYLLFASALIAASTTALTASKLRLDRLVATYDDAVWLRQQETADSALLVPRGAAEKQLDPVGLIRIETGDVAGSCRAVAAAYWTGDHYEAPAVSATTLGERPAVRLIVRTRCRNATPIGQITCTAAGDHVYAVLVKNAITSCRDPKAVLFPDRALLDRLLAGIRFED